MTDAEIIKALKCLAGEQTLCRNCTYKNTNPYPFCREICAKDALDLINRQNEYIKKCDNLERIADKTIASQKAEIERLQKGNNQFADIGKMYSEIKAEAIKEFAERLKERICQENELYKACAKGILSKDYQQGYEEKNDNILQHIDNLVKEMAGADNAN